METNPPVVSPPAPQNSGMKPTLIAALAYVLGFLSGLIVYLISKDPFARFHAIQSMLLSVFFYVVYYAIGLLGMWSLRSVAGLASLVISVFLIIKAYQGEKYRLPVIGDLAEKHS